MNPFKKFLRNKLLYFISTIILISISVSGSECDKSTNNGNNYTDITGTWQLIDMEGNLQDVCLGEFANFQANNIAILQCPNQGSISRQFTYSNSVLIYTETSVSYDVVHQTTNNISQIVLTGRNVSRTLTYNYISTDNAIINFKSDEKKNNSSNLSK